MKSIAVFLILLLTGLVSELRGQDVLSIEFGDFPNPKRIGVDSLSEGDSFIIGFDVTPDGALTGPGRTRLKSRFGILVCGCLLHP